MAQSTIDPTNLAEDLNEMLRDIEHNYIYLDEKKVDLQCIRETYQRRILDVKTEEEKVLFFEYLLDEFYDNHVILMTNRSSSYRLYAPIYIEKREDRFIVSEVWLDQEELTKKPLDFLLGAEVLTINGKPFENALTDFPTSCHDKTDPEVQEWLANKVAAGRYNEPRVIKLKLKSGKKVKFDLDKVVLKNEKSTLSFSLMKPYGYIRIHNSLGQDDLVRVFDDVMEKLKDRDGLIIDLRNTVFGGDSYEARGIMSRFINETKPYQKHAYLAKSFGNPDVERSWLELVTPRLEVYNKPIVVLVGRWTGSMGEGLAIGMEAICDATIVGTKMRRLAGEVFNFSMPNTSYGFKLSTTKLYHVNGTLREEYVPKEYIVMKKAEPYEEDQFIKRAKEILNEKVKELRNE